MSDLHEVVVAELDRLERLYGGDRKDGRHAALKWVVEAHHQCATCVTDCDFCHEEWPCDHLCAIAAALGIEVRDGE